MADQIDVFISYKLEERPLAESVMRALRQAGYVAVTNFNIAKTQEFGDAIDKMIRSARLTLALWTQKSATSDWVRKEARLAYSLEKAGKPNLYLGVMIDDVSLDLPVDLRGLQMVDLTTGGLSPENLALVVEAVQERIGRARSVSAEAAETTSSRAMDEFQLYEYARPLDIASGYEHFLSIYPNGKFAADARRELASARRWYMHPLRRGNLSHTWAVLGLLLGLFGFVWGASQQGKEGGVPFEAYDKVVEERNEAGTEGMAAKAEAVRLVKEVAALEKERDKAVGALTEFKSSLKASEAEVASLRANVGRLSNEITLRKLKEKELTANLMDAQRQLEAEKAEAARLTAEIGALKENHKTISAADLSEEEPKIVANGKHCTNNGSEGRYILGSCFFLNDTNIHLSFSAIESLEGFSDFSKLEYLSIAYTGVEDLGPISKLVGLEELDISHTGVEDLGPISKLGRLEELNISSTRVSDLGPIERLWSLKFLVLEGTPVSDLQPVANLANLVNINLSGTNVTDLSPLRLLDNLVFLTAPDGKVYNGRPEVILAITRMSPP